MNNRDKIIEKIKKLLALANNNSNQQEAIAAALKAQKYIAEYNIEDVELNGKNADETIEEILSEPYVGRRWREILAAIIAENFRCRNYISYTRKNAWTQGKEFTQVFVGYKSDAVAAKLVFEKLVVVGEECARNMCREIKAMYGTSQGVKNTFLLGFCYGVKQELEKQAQALMIVVPKSVDDYVENALAPSFESKSTIGSFELNETVFDATNEGRRAGRDAVRASRLDTSCENNIEQLLLV